MSSVITSYSIHYTKLYEEVSSGTVRQAASLEDSFEAVQGIDESALDVANGISSLLDAVEISSVITSYSIHYTKLYDSI